MTRGFIYGSLPALQLLVLGAVAPLVSGLARQIGAKLEGRQGAGVTQPYRELRKLFQKETLEPSTKSVFFTLAPYVLASSTAVIAMAGPFLATENSFSSSSDLLSVVGLLFLGNIAVALAGLDTGTSFGGMGASRELTVSSLVEPTILVAIFALSIPARSSNLGAIAAKSISNPNLIFAPGSLLALAAFIVVVLAEAKRFPVDNPSTHLELTMIHEAMLLEYSGPRLGVIEWASSLRLTILLGLVANLFFPVGLFSTGQSPILLLASCLIFLVKVLVLGSILSFAELFMAKLRLFRVPELLASSFILALLSVVTSYFFTATR